MRLESMKKFIWRFGRSFGAVFSWIYSRARITAIISMRLLVVSFSRPELPEIAFSFPFSIIIAAQPPGPGFPRQLPSVYTIISFIIVFVVT